MSDIALSHHEAWHSSLHQEVSSLSDSPILKLDTLSLRVWLRLLGCTRLIENEIRSKLREEHETTLPRFDVMAQLYRFPEGLRMGEISQLLMVTGGNITGIVDQLVHEDLVERTTAPDDRRAYKVKLTALGLTTFEAMAIEHRGWVGDLLAGLDADEQEGLIHLLGKLRDTLHRRQEQESDDNGTGR
jgi:DNA-binding MarR family transcriptional regulator